MAYYFTLSVECGGSLENANSCIHHFDAYHVQLNEVDYSFVAERFTLDDEEQIFWVVIYSPDLPSSNVFDKETADLYTDIGNKLLSHLSQISCFRFAIPGIESMDAIQYSAFDRELLINEKFINTFSGLVISRGMLSQLPNKDPFSTFGKEHTAITPYIFRLK